MSLRDYKITQNDIETKGVVAAPDVMSGDPQANKRIFDRLIREAVAEKFNDLVDVLIENGVEVILKRGDDSIQYIRLNADNVLEVSADGKEYEATGSSGHLILDADGNAMPQRGRLQFPDGSVEDIAGVTVVKSIGGIPVAQKGAPNGVAALDGTGKVIQPQQWQSSSNLLYNWCFANAVNQRGEASGNTFYNKYSIDCWIWDYSGDYGEFSLDSNGIKLIPAAGTTLIFRQKLENPTLLNGKTLTASFLFSNGELCTGTIVRVNDTSQTFFNKTGSFYATMNTSNAFQLLTTVETTVVAAKLELGTQQTLAHQDADGKWVLNEIPDYGEQLALCQRYAVAYNFTNVGSYWPCVAATATQAYCCITLPQNIRTVPTIVVDPSGFALRGKGVNHPVSSISVYSAASNMVNLLINTEGLTAGETYVLRSTAEGNLIISADL